VIVPSILGHKRFDGCLEKGKIDNGGKRKKAGSIVGGRVARAQPSCRQSPRYPHPRLIQEARMPDFPIVDTHVHLYDAKSVSYPWMKGNPILDAPHDPAVFSTAVAPVVVDKLVFVEVDAAPGQSAAEIAWVEAAAERDARIQGIVANIALERGRDIEADVAALAQRPLARGVRRLIQGHLDEPGWCLRPGYVDGVRIVAEYGLGCEICIKHPQLGDVLRLVEQVPHVRFVLDHIGKPGIKDGLVEPWKVGIRTLAAHPNVVCKISGVVTEADFRTWTYDQVAPYIAHCIESFGFDRVMFGGDWPVLELAGNYPGWVSVVDRVVAGSTVAEQRKLFRDNAIRVYRLG
jgi:L-fuconolactonase